MPSHNIPFKTQKDMRAEAEILADPFETRPFENQVKCQFCHKPYSVKFK